ncbi:hypothetical protein TNCV_5004671 [Trichonephila clavipes]|uniref:Uncharacterized protein n=1 Tax=Trichonephila clavipes TaxID=2585209 RepID=A0A8X6RBM4_TRICX|nr:hypothetical protein TNCV_5004671 [Trichonephila clavipes]
MPIYSVKEVSGDFTDSLSDSGDFKVSSKIDISHIPMGIENLSNNYILRAFNLAFSTLRSGSPFGRSHLRLTWDTLTSRKVFSEESVWKSESSYWLLKSEGNGSGKMAAHVGSSLKDRATSIRFILAADLPTFDKTTSDMATDKINDMECQNIPLPTSRPGTPEDLFTPCERQIQVQNEIKKFTLLTIGARDSLNSLAPFMTCDDPEVTELFNRHKYYQEELHR